MCTHTTIHYTHCLCIATRTTTPCSESEGAGYRGSICPAFEHVKLFISASDPTYCLRHPEGGGGDRTEAGSKNGGSPERKGGLVHGAKSGLVKETVKIIEGMISEEDKLLDSLGDWINNPIRTDLSPQSKIFKFINHGGSTAKPAPQTPPQRHFNKSNTEIRDRTSTEITSRSSIYSSSSSSSSSSFHQTDSPHKHGSHSSSSSMDPFYIQTPKLSNASFNPYDAFSQSEDVIYGGTSLLDVPIDGTEWNWNGKRWIGVRAVHVAGLQEEMDFAGLQMRRK